MRIFVTGRTGQLASALVERSRDMEDISVIAAGRPEFDLEDRTSVAATLRAARPDIIVNAAAYTAVDRAEQEPGKAFAINRDGAETVAMQAAAAGIPLIHVSTDYVYSGRKPEPYVEGDATGPLGVYGASKLAGEQAVREAHPSPLILRTSWVYSPYGANFVKTMLRLAGTRPEIGVVDDQTGNPTSALDLASAILRIAGDAQGGGTFHLCGSGSTSWCGLARHVFAESRARGGPAAEVRAITTAEYPTPARRPVNSQLSMDAFTARFGFCLRPWQEGVSESVARIIAQGDAA